MVKIVSFDVWDTILKRKCHPEEIKLYTCGYIFNKYTDDLKSEYITIYDIYKERNKIENEICAKNRGAGLDYECDIDSVIKSLIERVCKDDSNTDIKEIVMIEIEHEKRMTYINEDFKYLFEKYKNCDLYCISDFYMGKEYISEIFKYHNIYNNFKDIFVSCDYMLTKRSGKLFNKVKEELSISFDNMLHIGDNENSDIKVPISLGISTRKIINHDNYKKIFDRVFDEKAVFGKLDKKSLIDIGKALSIIPYYFVKNILSNANDKIYYFTREGEFFIKVHDIINQNNNYHLNNIDSELLEVSRVATFSASLKDFSIDSLMNIWNQYKKQSIRTLYVSLGINIEKYLDYFEKYNIDVNVELDKPWENKNIKRIFDDYEFVAKMNEEITTKRNQLINYFSKKGIKLDDKPLTVVDIGWRGTIQDNISRIYDNKKITGYYIALFDFFNKQEKNTEKFSAIKDKYVIYNYLNGLITFLEMLFIPNSGSVIEYVDGKANRKILEEEYKLITKNIIELQKGMLEGVRILDKYFFEHPYDLSDMYNIFIDKIKEIRVNPPKELTKVYFKMVLNDSFGAGKYVYKNSKLKFYQKFNVKYVLNQLRKESFKEAYLIYNDLHLYKLLFDIKNSRKRKEKNES